MSAVAFLHSGASLHIYIYHGICNELEYCGEKKYFRHCSLQFSLWRLTRSHFREKYRGEWERLREMFYIFYRQSLPRVLRKAESRPGRRGALKSLIHPLRGHRDSPGIQIAIPLETTVSRFRDIGKHWHEFFPYYEIIVIYVLVYLYKQNYWDLLWKLKVRCYVFFLLSWWFSPSLSFASLWKVLVLT